MLGSLRKYSSGTGVKVLYGLLALSFLLFFVTPLGHDRMDVVAKVRGERITRTALDNQAAQMQRRFSEMFQGATLPGMNFRARALDELIDDALLRHEADRLGLRVTDDDVVRTITTMPELQENGRFSRDILERVLEFQRDRGEFEAQVRQDILNQRLRSLVVDGVQVSDAEIDDRYRNDREQVDLMFVRVSAADLAKGISPTDQEMESWLAGHADVYRTPPRVRVRYVAYLPKDFAAMAAPSEEAVKAYYDAHAGDRFTEPEEVRARHILIRIPPGADDAAKAKARSTIEDVQKKLAAGGDFAELAKQLSEDPGSAGKGGDLGFFPRGRMVPEFDAVAFAQEPGSTSEVVETPFGFHLIKVEEKKAGGQKPLDAVREQIVKTLTDERALELARKQAESDRRAVVLGKSLTEAASGRTVQETAPFAAGDDIPGVGRVKAFEDVAFALAVDTPSDLIETDEAVYLLVPIERFEPATPPLADVRDKVRADVQRSRGEALARERAEALLARAKEIGLERAAADAGYKLDTTGAFERRAGGAPKLGASPELRADAFTLTTEAPLGNRTYAVGGDAAVVALKARIPADAAALASAKDGLRQQILQEKQQDVLMRFMNHLKEQARADGALEVRGDAVAG